MELVNKEVEKSNESRSKGVNNTAGIRSTAVSIFAVSFGLASAGTKEAVARLDRNPFALMDTCRLDYALIMRLAPRSNEVETRSVIHIYENRETGIQK